jgi:hypothetical protein
MDQDPLVTDRITIGRRLIDALLGDNFVVKVALWAKPTEQGRWYLYLASPIVDEQGPLAAYKRLVRIMRSNPDLSPPWIDSVDVRLIGLNDSIAAAASDLLRPSVPDSPFAVQNPKPFPGMTRYGGSTLGGVDIEGAILYPPLVPTSV